MKRSLPFIVVFIVVFALAGLYFNGNLDRPLYGIGLNYHECARNGLGATFCGKELDEYRRRVEGVQKRLTSAKEGLETTERTSREEATTREQERTQEHHDEERKLEAKMRKERAIVEAEPQGSYAFDLARDEYESARSELQQARVNSEGG